MHCEPETSNKEKVLLHLDRVPKHHVVALAQNTEKKGRVGFLIFYSNVLLFVWSSICLDPCLNRCLLHAGVGSRSSFLMASQRAAGKSASPLLS